MKKSDTQSNKSMEQLVVEELKDWLVENKFETSGTKMLVDMFNLFAHSLCTKVIEAYGMDKDKVREIVVALIEKVVKICLGNEVSRLKKNKALMSIGAKAVSQLCTLLPKLDREIPDPHKCSTCGLLTDKTFRQLQLENDRLKALIPDREKIENEVFELLKGKMILSNQGIICNKQSFIDNLTLVILKEQEKE